MSTVTMAEKRDLIRKDLVSKGWIIDRWGHATREVSGTKFRYKFQAHTIRLEKQIKIDGKNEWVRKVTHSVNEVYRKLQEAEKSKPE